MNCEQISLKAQELNIQPKDINIIKETKNGWIIKSLTENKEIQNKIEQLKKYIIDNQILTELEYTDSLKRYYELQDKEHTLSGLDDIEEQEYDKLYKDILNFEENR